jgi:hypothetical protein
MTRRPTLFLLPAVLLVASSPACRAQSGYDAPDCGTNALYLLMKLQGMTSGLNEIQSALPPPREQGYSMLELQSAAKACGLHLVGVRFRPASAPLPGSVIAHRPGHKPASGHFVVLRPLGSNNTMIQVIDPPYAPQLIDYPALFGGKGEPVMILRPATAFETWAHYAVPLVIAVFCLSLLAVRLIRQRGIRGSSATPKP